MTKFSFKDAPDLMVDLVQAQNHPANINQDIMSFAAMASSRDELEAHIFHYAIRAERYDQDVEHGVVPE